MTGIVPAPTSFELRGEDAPFRLTEDSRIVARGGGAAAVAETFAARARATTGFALPVVGGEPAASDLAFVIAGGEAPGGATEGYTLEAGAGGVRLGADTAEGLFRGTQSLRQLLPAEIERADAPSTPAGGWTVPAASVADAPRFAYRGVMLDVARHFFPVEDVLDLVDHIALLKFNVLHLHLTDDQGWRLEIESWPELTGTGASTSVGGDGGGFYTRDDYRRIVAYATERFVTIVPEIDLPGHTNAALSAYPELNCDGVARAPYEGTEVAFSSLCASPERAQATDRFLADVTREVADLTPGPWLHLGGDESLATSPADYRDLARRIAAAGAATGKTVIGWHELGASPELPPGTVGQYWSFVEPAADAAELTRSIVDQGGKIIMSPADVAYLDMQYADDRQGPLGLDWAKGPTTIDEAYLWDPAAIVPGVGEHEILGVEAPVWTETLGTMPEVEFMLFPRVAAIAEVAWSPAERRDFDGFLDRVAALGRHLDALGVEYHPVRGVPWAEWGAAAASTRLRDAAGREAAHEPLLDEHEEHDHGDDRHDRDAEHVVP
ncbi:family 20 glycosylhydrolase [Agromyces bauzanensis]|uniref:beta-N-acetylhexosaminidase n=1 Tax=Agromyces bauzanensis TaxID=1308924 RepID=A0A917PG45_9MICO|nr:family 20 glycosylhydrolase [Agromyces bauzanensis]GGJ75653.1 beta-N-acetylhexosaminidase [Agromyces bauzanensis]